MALSPQTAPSRLDLSAAEIRERILDSLLEAKVSGNKSTEQAVRAELASEFGMTETQISSIGAYFPIKGNNLLKLYQQNVTLTQLMQSAWLSRQAKQVSPELAELTSKFIDAVYERTAQTRVAKNGAGLVLPTIIPEFSFSVHDQDYLDTHFPAAKRSTLEVWNLGGDSCARALHQAGFLSARTPSDDEISALSTNKSPSLVVIDARVSAVADLDVFRSLANANETHFISHLHSAEIRVKTNLLDDIPLMLFLLNAEILRDERFELLASLHEEACKLARGTSVKASELDKLYQRAFSIDSFDKAGVTAAEIRAGMQLYIPSLVRGLISTPQHEPILNWAKLSCDYVVPDQKQIRQILQAGQADDFITRRCQITALKNPKPWVQLSQNEALLYLNLLGVMTDTFFSSCYSGPLRQGAVSIDYVVPNRLTEWIDSVTFQRPNIHGFTSERCVSSGDPLIHFYQRGSIRQIDYAHQISSPTYRLCEYYANAVANYLSKEWYALPGLVKTTQKSKLLTFSDRYEGVVVNLNNVAGKRLSLAMSEVMGPLQLLVDQTYAATKEVTLLGHFARNAKKIAKRLEHGN